MAGINAETLEDFMPHVLSTDTKHRLQTYEVIVEFLQSPDSVLYCREFDKMVDALVGWICSSNYKVSLCGLDIVACLIDRMGSNFSPYVPTVLSPVVDRLGDGKDQVRDQALVLLLRLMVPASSPQYIVDRLPLAFTHKVWKVREETLRFLQRALSEFGTKNMTLSKIVPFIVKMLEDSNLQVKEQAANTLLVIYQHVGERLRADLAKKDIHPAKLAQLFARMDELRNAGSVAMPAVDARNDDNDTEDGSLSAASSKSSIRLGASSSSGGLAAVRTAQRHSMPGMGEDTVDASKLPGPRGTVSRGSTVTGTGLKSASTGSANSSGAVDEDIFVKQFDQVPKINIFSAKELNDRLSKIRDMFNDQNLDWNKRVDAMKELRACFYAGAVDYSDFVTVQLASLELSFQQLVRDLRSQVVREACITISFMAQQLGKEFGHFAEMVLPSLILLIQNSARIMATSGTVAIRFIIQHTHNARLVPIITSNFTSKSNITRRQCCEFLYLIVQSWSTQSLERQVTTIQDALKKGISDADAEARVFSRRAFWGFADHFRGQADSLLASLDAAKQKQLFTEQPSNSSSSLSLNSIGRSCPSTPARQVGAMSSAAGRNSTAAAAGARAGASKSVVNGSGHKRSASFSSKQMFSLTQSYDENSLHYALRSFEGHSAYDLTDGRQLAQQQQQYSAVGSSIPPLQSLNARTRKYVNGNGTGSGPASQMTATLDRSRNRSRMTASQSQPSSRSGSPTPRLSYLTNTQADVGPRTGGRNHARPSALPRSQGSSREGSPTRSYGRERRFSGGQALSQGTRQRPTSRSARALSLSQSDDMDNAMADALRNSGARSNVESYDSDDQASETSSVCSDGNFRGYGRLPQIEDVSEIVNYLSSGTWSERREGLLALQNFIINNRIINRNELKRITEIFTRMFHDPHGKVFSVFLDTLILIVPVYHTDLTEWLYICITRLLTKTGVDMLASVQAKIQKALDVIRNTFVASHQFSLLARYIVDQSQSPNIKVKVSMLCYMHGLIDMMQPQDFSNTSDIRLAVSRIVTWTTEPKSIDVRKAAQAVLIALYYLNTPEFNTMLSVLPKTFQDGAGRILQNHLRSAASNGQTTTAVTGTTTSRPSANIRSRPSSDGVSGAPTDNIENMKPEDVHNSIKKASADISRYVEVRSSPPPPARGDSASWHLPVCRSPEKYGTTVPATYHQRQQYNPTAYGDRAYDDERQMELDTGIDAIQQILVELSNHNTRFDERQTVLLTLIKKAREEPSSVWDEYFSAVLLILLETLGDIDGHIRALAVRVLAEFIRCHADRFGEYIELTIVKTLEAHKDPVKEVTRAAEECAMLLGRLVVPTRAVKILKLMLDSDDFLVNLGAIKMLKQLAENNSKDKILIVLPDIVPGLLKGYDHIQSCIRKATVICLVEIYLCVGEDLRPYLKDLNGSKIKLLNVYIKRALEQRGEKSLSDTSSPTSAVDPL